ncbi:MAG: NADH-quinone oxidoreductase subunit C [SAR86 cluster bacterium]|jgi:NADH-quinone oxidoreductase subunit C|uniref:NADH-quinone oxidoreductase subunit C n=1 Tax=Candidatus Pseudothioglobus singularis PS1 TaxID=1125411 RepID=A0A0M3T1R2_9GAMM|nr:NADH-quinone oxidoreductase subunit C [Candidatus Pseudothioglobus singularis]MDA9642324.1 NADH-quinone oxidoreductase subunit C [Candidatus Thioglobus sp.]MDC3389042.1 NADH-quinone oxidoreductase subunit C [bacterium]MDO7577915.1 NADH-quinone oxidoreductase subunit C [SAR86 cluster bacterium]ALE01455.1 NADH dehydrogenase subunit C [Candidatus Pseudothioglobus singularis PS1]ANQ66122.1 NADH-quinone oxidoreductase subunit C [Candidatus Pseudothioglobus singularis]|tara:strand:- start:4065 stop:4679 length:615 start_codon:yes stop_codon:yes gene_type:complete
MKELKQKLSKAFGKKNVTEAYDELTLVINSDNVVEVCHKLKDEFKFEILIDLCGVDYLTYGESDWNGNASSSGFGRARQAQKSTNQKDQRFGVIYHLLSVSSNQRLRVKALLSTDNLMIQSVTKIWNCADWFEREAFDLFGILFENHNDLRRILTDYGFVGHPLRKDFPMIGEVEMRYDDQLGRVVYEPVSIEPNVNVPRVIRK